MPLVLFRDCGEGIVTIYEAILSKRWNGTCFADKSLCDYLVVRVKKLLKLFLL